MTAVVSYLPTSGFAPQVRRATPRLRLTRRGRAVFTALAVVPLLIAGLVFGLGAGGAVATRDAASDSLTWVTVDAGQSLWDLAAEIAPAEDPREFAAQVAAFNQLESTVIQPGQELAIPPRYAD
jgi:hypothetical protein